ncbi:MAG: radical SAM family heme chaperone HemW [Pleurocapsa sp.]
MSQESPSKATLGAYWRECQSSIPTAAYLHIPFCRRRCYYCDFPISVVGDRLTHVSTTIEDYVAALCREIELTAKPQQPLQTVFFGGGTPSLLSVRQLTTILKVLDKHLGIASDAEISMEIDPGTFNREQILGYLNGGVNRISLGVQTFDDQLLKICGRSHSYADIMQAIALIQQIAVPNFSLDLISGLPHQTLEQCQISLTQAIAISPHHLSCYDLVLEPVTAFGKQYQPGKKPLPTDEIAANMYRLTQQMLTNAGYQHYEISNYARPGYQCRHNRVYWENKPYYGFGMGAASYLDGKRFTRPRTRREYYDWLSKGAIINEPELSPTDRLLESLMLGLRLSEGVDLSSCDHSTADKIWHCLQPYYRQGLIEITQDKAIITRLRLRDSEGFLFSNTILSTLFEKLEDT